MELRPGYKQTEVGVIPEEWELLPVSKLGETKRGASSLCIQYTNSSGARLIRINDFFEENPVFVKPNAEIMRFALQERDLLFAGTGASAGASYLPPKEWLGLPHSYNAPRISVFKEHNKELLFYSLQSDYVRRQQRAWFVGNAQPFLDTKAIGNLAIAVPPTKDERDAIAEALRDVDGLLGALDRLIAKKRDLKQAAMQQLLTGQTRLPGFSGDWEMLPFEAIFRKVPAKSYQIQTTEYRQSGAYPVIDQGQSAIVGFSDREDKVFRVPESGVVIFGDHTCIVKFVCHDFVVGADGTQILVAKNEQHAAFHAYSLMYKGVETTGYSRHFKLLKERFFQAPPFPEQCAIAAVLSDMDAEIEALENRRAKTRDLKQAMMQELLTGRIRLV